MKFVKDQWYLYKSKYYQFTGTNISGEPLFRRSGITGTYPLIVNKYPTR